jgi:hypothetical protein
MRRRAVLRLHTGPWDSRQAGIDRVLPALAQPAAPSVLEMDWDDEGGARRRPVGRVPADRRGSGEDASPRVGAGSRPAHSAVIGSGFWNCLDDHCRNAEIVNRTRGFRVRYFIPAIILLVLVQAVAAADAVRVRAVADKATPAVVALRAVIGRGEHDLGCIPGIQLISIKDSE